MTSQAHNAHAAFLGQPGPPLEHGGRVYRARPLDQASKAELERRLTAQAMAAAAMAPPAFRAEALAAVAAEAAGGAYGFYGQASQRALASPSGMLQLAAVLFGVEADEAAALVEARPEEAKAMLDLAVLESLPEASRRRVLAAREAARKAEAGEEARPTQAPA